MRSREAIEREMYRAREDLESSLSELRHLVAEKLEVKARARHAIDQRTDRVRELARERPLVVAAVVGGILVVGVLTVVAVQRQHQRQDRHRQRRRCSS